MHAVQGRLVFLLRNMGMLGGVLILVAEHRESTQTRRVCRLVARVLLSLHGLEVAPLKSWTIVAIVDMISFPLTILIIMGVSTRRVAVLLAVEVIVSDMWLNRGWVIHTERDDIRFYFFEDLSLVGGLLLLALHHPREQDIDLHVLPEGSERPNKISIPSDDDPERHTLLHGDD